MVRQRIWTVSFSCAGSSCVKEVLDIGSVSPESAPHSGGIMPLGSGCFAQVAALSPGHRGVCEKNWASLPPSEEIQRMYRRAR